MSNSIFTSRVIKIKEIEQKIANCFKQIQKGHIRKLSKIDTTILYDYYDKLKAFQQDSIHSLLSTSIKKAMEDIQLLLLII